MSDTETMSEVGLLRLQAGATREVIRLNLAGLTHEESVIQPRPGGNCLNWIVGHLLSVYNSALPLLGQEPVMERALLKRYERGSPPLERASDALNFTELLASWNKATERIDAGLSGLTGDVLHRPAPRSPTGNPDETIGSLLATVLFHQAYHAGQIGVLRRLVGREGAIR